MTVLLVLFVFVLFLSIDSFKTWYENRVPATRGTTITTPGFEMLGALAQDGGSTLESEAAETEEVMSKMKRTMEVGASK
jgi:hypothetical protein